MQIISAGLARRRRGKTQLKIASAGCQWLKLYFFISFMVNMYSAFVIICVHSWLNPFFLRVSAPPRETLPLSSFFV